MVKLDNLTVSYRQHPALHHVSGHFKAGSLTAVIGPNGSGKSTLLKSILGLLPVAGGHVAVGTDRRRIAYLPQLAGIDRGFPMTVHDCVLLGCWSRQGAWRQAGRADMGQIENALRSVGLEGFEQRPISTLSSGQLQRVLFARMLVQDAQLILLDEPFNAIDSKTTAALLAIIAECHRQQRTVIAVLHDDAQVRSHFPHTLMLARQLIAWGPTASVLTEDNLQRARAMAEAWDDDAGLCKIDAELSAPQQQTPYRAKANAP